MASTSRSVLAASFVGLFAVASGVGYGVGRVLPGETAPGDAVASAPATPPRGPSTTAAPTTTEAPTTAAPTTTTTQVATTTTAPPAPLRVIMAGDSVMAGLAPAVRAALAPTGAEVRFVLTPTIASDPTIRYTWQRQLDDVDPDLVVMFVGTWETGSVTAANGTGPGEAAWRASYERDTLDPWVRMISSKGARVIWIGNATVGSDGANTLFASLNDAFRQLPQRWPQVTFLDSDRSLHGPQAGFSAVIPGPDGRLVRTRQTDLLHLCPDGAALLGADVVAEIEREFPVRVPGGWASGEWRSDIVYPIDGCPAP